jgi:hypothetical protein
LPSARAFGRPDRSGPQPGAAPHRNGRSCARWFFVRDAGNDIRLAFLLGQFEMASLLGPALPALPCSRSSVPPIRCCGAAKPTCWRSWRVLTALLVWASNRVSRDIAERQA